MEQSLSTQLAIQDPKSIIIKQGGWYATESSYGTITKTQVLRIRTNGSEVMVYYRTLRNRSLFGNSYGYDKCSLESFKSKLVDLGSVNQLVVHPLVKDNK